MGWAERRVFVDQCETNIAFDFSEGDRFNLERAAFFVLLASIYRVQHGYDYFNKQTLYSRERIDSSEERLQVYRQILNLQDLLQQWGMSEADSKALIDAELSVPGGQLRDDELRIKCLLEYPIEPVDFPGTIYRNYWGMDVGGPLSSLKDVAELMSCSNERDSNAVISAPHSNMGFAGTIERVFEAVDWPVKVLDGQRLVIDGIPPSIKLVLNQHIYPLFQDPKEELAVIMDEAALAGLAEFHSSGSMVIKGEAWGKHETYHQFEFVWKFKEGSEKRFSRHFRLGFPKGDRIRRSSIEWEAWQVVSNPDFGYFTLSPEYLRFDLPNRNEIELNRPNENWKSFRNRIGF